MASSVENKVAEYIESQGLFAGRRKGLLAVSGGADSTALMHLMCSLHDRGVVNVELAVAHLHHQLRGSEADEDERFVARQARSMGLDCVCRRLDVKGYAAGEKVSVETAGRQLRIAALVEIAGEGGCDCVMTGHHKDDNAETVLQRLARGTGYRGIGGIWPARKLMGEVEFVRPLLCVTRSEIIDYLRLHGLSWRADRMNADCRYRRSFIRHRLMPEIQKQCNASVSQMLFELSTKARGFYQRLCACAEQIEPKVIVSTNDKVILDLEGFALQIKPVKVELLRRALTAIGCGQGNLSRRHFEKMLSLSAQQAGGKKLELPGGFSVRCEYGKLVFGRSRPDECVRSVTAEQVQVSIPGRTGFCVYDIEAEILDFGASQFEAFKAAKDSYVEWFDMDKIRPPLTVRFRRTGDRFQPLGPAGEKKVGKFLTSQKVPCSARRNVLIIADADKIIWLWPVRISEQAKVTDQTRRILRLRICASS